MSMALNFSKSKSYVDEVNKNTTRNSRGVPFPGFQDKDINEVLVAPDDFGSPALFIITFNPQGYIIISATKKETPIQGYSTESKFDIKNLPPGLGGWIMNRVSKIQKINYDVNNKGNIEISSMWASRAPISKGNIDWDTDSDGNWRPSKRSVINKSAKYVYEEIGVSKLLTTQWGQDNGYNNSIPLSCPKSFRRGGKPPTGCVPTAVAQVMKYHAHPASSKSDKYTYYHDWAAMPDKIISENVYSGGAMEIAELMSVIGYHLNTIYRCDESGTKMEYVTNALINHYNYSDTAKYVDYNLNEIINELNNKRPVILSATTTIGRFLWFTYPIGGHAWVCDGWKENLRKHIVTYHTYDSKYSYDVNESTLSLGKFLHMNWGWGEDWNNRNNGGWFKHDNFKVDLYNKSGDYKYFRKMVIGIKPAS